MVEAILKAVSNAANRSILALLAVEPTYPRRIGILLGLAEGEVARRLKRLEGLGLVASQWQRHADKRNVKVYRLAASTITIRLQASGLEVDVGSARPSQAAAPVLPNIPAVATFVGRKEEMAALSGANPVLVLGMAGVGKTTLLAQHVAQEDRPVFWRSFRGVESMTWLANQVALFLATRGDASLLDRLEADPSPAAAHEATLRAMEASRATFVLDDVHRADDEGVRAFVADAVARVKEARLLVGSREWIAHDPSRPGLRILRLAGLADGDAAALLAARGVEVPPALVPRLRAEAGGHPLALNLLAQAALQAGDLERLLDRVPETDLESWLVEEIDARLAEDERLVLAHASLFRTPFTPSDLVALSGKRLEGALTRLRRRMLVLDSPGGHTLGEVVRNHFYARLQDKKGLHARAAQHALAKGTLESRLEAMHHYLAAGERRKVLDLIGANLDLQDFAFIDAGYHRLYDAVLSAFQRKDVADGRQWALILDERADIRLHAGEAAEALALYEEALGILRDLRDKTAADAAWKAALCLERLGRADEAVRLCQGSLAQAPEGQARERLEEALARLQANRPQLAV